MLEIYTNNSYNGNYGRIKTITIPFLSIPHSGEGLSFHRGCFDAASPDAVVFCASGRVSDHNPDLNSVGHIALGNRIKKVIEGFRKTPNDSARRGVLRHKRSMTGRKNPAPCSGEYERPINLLTFYRPHIYFRVVLIKSRLLSNCPDKRGECVR